MLVIGFWLVSFGRFLLQLSCQSPVLDGPGNLSVVEANAFKHLNHLSLRLLQGSDRDVKDYLAACFSTLKVAQSIRGGCVGKLFAIISTSYIFTRLSSTKCSVPFHVSGREAGPGDEAAEDGGGPEQTAG